MAQYEGGASSDAFSFYSMQLTTSGPCQNPPPTADRPIYVDDLFDPSLPNKRVCNIIKGGDWSVSEDPQNVLQYSKCVRLSHSSRNT